MGEAAQLAVLLGRRAQPVDLGVAADGLVEGVDEDDLKSIILSTQVLKCRGIR